MLHERDAKHQGTDGAGQRHSNPARTPATVQWDATDASTSPPPQKEQQDEPMSCGEPDSAAEVNSKSAFCPILLVKTSRDDSATTLGAKMQLADAAVAPSTPCLLFMWMTHLFLNKAVFVGVLSLFSGTMCQHLMTGRSHLHRGILWSREMLFYWDKSKLAGEEREGQRAYVFT